jgi:hypothetical protein
MSNRLKIFAVVLFTAILSLVALASAQTPTPRAAGIPRMPDGKPNFTGLWQSLGTAYWDIRDHSAQAGAFYQLGATGAEPAGQGIVEAGDIPYKPEAAAKQKENFKNRLTQDPEVKCFMPGVPRGTYMPFPFQIIQSQRDIAIAYEYATANRVINMGKAKEAAVDTWMGTSNGRWQGDTLIVDVTGLNGNSWFDRVGNFQSENTHIVESYSFADADHLNYEATIEDSTLYTRPWKISLPLYRRKEKGAQLNEFKCVEFAEELIYGNLRKK